MLVDRHLGTPNLSFLFALLDVVIECVIQYYTDRCSERLADFSIFKMAYLYEDYLWLNMCYLHQKILLNVIIIALLLNVLKCLKVRCAW